MVISLFLRKCGLSKKHSAPWGLRGGFFSLAVQFVRFGLNAGDHETREMFVFLISAVYYVTLLEKIPISAAIMGL